MLLWIRLLDSKLFIVIILALFAIASSAVFTLSKSVETQSLQEQKSLTPALSLVVQEIMKPLYVAETIARVSPLKDWLNDPQIDPQQIHAKLVELSKEFDMDFFVASEKNRTQYNSDGTMQALLEGKVEWYFRDKKSTEQIIGALGNRQDIRIYYDIKVYAPNGEFLGFIGVSRKLASFLESFNEFKKKYGYDFLFVNHNDNIVLSSDKSIVADGKRIMRLQQMPWFSALDTELLENANQHSLLVDVNGDDFLIAEAKLHAINWKLFIVNPLEARQDAATQRFAILTFYIFALLTIVAFIARYAIIYVQGQFAKTHQKDPLTKLPNRAQLNWRFEQLSHIDQPVSVVLVDLDHFKTINDNHGHAIGDVVLKKIANILLTHIRDEDLVARWGGEEFVMLLPDTKLEDAHKLAERARQTIFESEVSVGSEIHKLTASFGVAASDKPVHRLSHLLSKADKALYQAKAEGRNAVCCADDTTEQADNTLAHVH